jgi:glycosyltransferase involved in cell wall biosynthesis
MYSKRAGLEYLAARKKEALAEADRLSQTFEAEGKTPDLWFSYHPYDKSPDFLGEEICRRHAIPLVTAEPCKTSQGPNGEWLPWRAESKRIIASAAMNLVMTHSDQAFLSTFVPPERIEWFDPFVDRSLLEAEPTPDDPWKRKKGVRLLTVGMMRPGAKLESYGVLAGALKGLLDLDWSLAIAGGGPCEPEIRTFFSALPKDRVEFLGVRPAGQVLTLMERADVLAWPGCREAYGMVYLEAASRGTPAVALSTMGVPRVVQDGRTGLLADPDVAGSYQAALRQMIEDTGLRTRLGEGARAFVDGERSGEAAAAHLKRIIDAVHLKTGR